VSRAA